MKKDNSLENCLFSRKTTPFSPDFSPKNSKKFLPERKCLIPKKKKKKSLALPNLFSKLSQHPILAKIPDLNISKKSGEKSNSTKDLEFYQEQILSQIPHEEITRKKVREFVKTQKWKKVRGNDHEIFNHITNHDGNDYEHLEEFLIDDFKYFSLAYNDLCLNRQKFLNYEQVLFALLKKNGFHPNEDDFKLLILPSRRAEQEKIIREIFKRNNWKENGS